MQQLKHTHTPIHTVIDISVRACLECTYMYMHKYIYVHVHDKMIHTHTTDCTLTSGYTCKLIKVHVPVHVHVDCEPLKAFKSDTLI